MNTEQTKDCEWCRQQAEKYKGFKSLRQYYDYCWNTFGTIDIRYSNFFWYWTDCVSPQESHAQSTP